MISPETGDVPSGSASNEAIVTPTVPEKPPPPPYQQYEGTAGPAPMPAPMPAVQPVSYAQSTTVTAIGLSGNPHTVGRWSHSLLG